MPILQRTAFRRVLFSRSRGLATIPSNSGSTTPRVTLGLRREDPARIWERRCPITPEVVHDLVHKEGVNVLVQNCERRVYPASEFAKAGAQITESLHPAHIILGIKETPLNELITSPVRLGGAPMARTHLMFSHTIKGQPYNRELLSRFLQDDPVTKAYHGAPHPRLIDHELITKEDGKRTVGFGWFAGVAGALESLSSMAHNHLELGVASPFLHTPRPHTHPSLTSLRTALREIGNNIAENGTPPSLGPFVIGLTGAGKVSQGCLAILEELPIEHVKPEDLPSLVSDPDTDLRKIYLVHALPRHYLVREGGLPYDRTHYYANPDAYKSEFASRIAPYLTLFLNGTGWSSTFPRLMSNEQLAIALEKAQQVGKARFANIGDISCDIEGGLQFLERSSTLSEPHYKVRPVCVPKHLPDVQMMAVDILPASIPLDASEHFSGALYPYLSNLIREYRGEKTEAQYTDALDRATVTRDGDLLPQHQWLWDGVNSWRGEDAKAAAATSKTSSPSSSTPNLFGDSTSAKASTTTTTPAAPKKKKVLMLGSGMVAGPAIDELAKRSDIELLVASNSLTEAENLTRKHGNAKAMLVDMADRGSVSRLVEESDVVISLLPVPFHRSVAEFCVKHRKNMVTASYISPAMKELHQQAIDADILILNEIGLDPGIDHCSALALLDELKAKNKKIVSFTSFCGGLPAPECAEVPLGYKFSWSPRGVLNAALNGAKFRLNGTNWEIPGEDILKMHFPEVPISNVLRLEGIANRDSFPYAEEYGLGKPEGLRTLLRGTLRFPGFSAIVHAFKALGLLDSTPLRVENWEHLAQRSVEARLGLRVPNDPSSLIAAISDVVPSDRVESVLEALRYLSLVPPPSGPEASRAMGVAGDLPGLPKAPTPAIELLTTLLARRLRYEPRERDLVILSHEIVARPLAPGAPEEVHTSSLVAYGDENASAMARTVGLPVAFATLEVLDGNVSLRGVGGPTEKALVRGVLAGLERAGLGMKESVRVGRGMESVLESGLMKAV